MNSAVENVLAYSSLLCKANFVVYSYLGLNLYYTALLMFHVSLINHVRSKV
jgi:hypothetical protein